MRERQRLTEPLLHPKVIITTDVTLISDLIVHKIQKLLTFKIYSYQLIIYNIVQDCLDCLHHLT